MPADAPIFRFNRDRALLVAQTVDRVCQEVADPLHALNDAAYWEIKRLEGSRREKDQQELGRVKSLARGLSRLGEAERAAKLRELCTHYAGDIAGNFEPRVYQLATRIMPSLVTALLAPGSLPRKLAHPTELASLEALAEKVVVQGDCKLLRALAEIGTLVFVPTHASNMDSIVFGFALEASGLPPATYGAGKNLFTNPLLSFFMHNLGAYKVDRRLKFELYKECLKTYSCLLIEHGYHSLFFPGGTRSRSGAVETRLKLGLAGTGVEAYVRSILAGRERKVFFVPATINYSIALEAETLIEDYLSEAGKARYIIEDDESSRISRVLAFGKKLLTMDGSVVVRFGQPLDPFGNLVDAAGGSHDARGRAIQTRSYVEDLRGQVVLDAARDAQYTRELGRELCRSYLANTVVMPTHAVCAAAFDLLRQQAPAADLFTLLRLRDQKTSKEALERAVAGLGAELAGLDRAGEIVLSEAMRDEPARVVHSALAALSGYHTTKVVEPDDGQLFLRDPKLLFYYQNRLARHGLGFDAERKKAVA